MSEISVENKPLKVLHLIDSGGLYGAEKMLLALVAEQIKQGLKVVILSAGEPNQTEKALEYAAKNLKYPVKVWRMKAGFNIREAWKIISWAKSEKFDLLHSHGYKFNLLMSVFPKFIRNLPLITTVHGYVKAKKYSKMWLYEWLDQRALSRMDKVCVVSEPMLSMSFAKKITKKRIICIANGIEEKAQLQQLTPQISTFINQYPMCLAAIGRLSPEKGFSDLLQALAGVFRQQPELKIQLGLVVIGEGSLRADLEKEIECLQLESNVLMAGYQDNAGDTLVNFRGLVMPSKTEGLPITLLEAMRVGCPILATKVGGIPSVLNEANSILVDAGNLEQLQSAVRVLIDNPSDAECLASKAQQDFLDKYTAAEMSHKYSHVYSRIYETL